MSIRKKFTSFHKSAAHTVQKQGRGLVLLRSQGREGIARIANNSDLRLQPRQRPKCNRLQALPELRVLHRQPATTFLPISSLQDRCRATLVS